SRSFRSRQNPTGPQCSAAEGSCGRPSVLPSRHHQKYTPSPCLFFQYCSFFSPPFLLLTVLHFHCLSLLRTSPAEAIRAPPGSSGSRSPTHARRLLPHK